MHTKVVRRNRWCGNEQDNHQIVTVIGVTKSKKENVVQLGQENDCTRSKIMSHQNVQRYYDEAIGRGSKLELTRDGYLKSRISICKMGSVQLL